MRDIALPIGCGQTTMQPSFVARLLEALALKGQEHVLEVGSGSGFVTALLAALCRRVEGVERYRGLAEGAAASLGSLDLGHASVAWSDGLAPAAGTFDRILVHAALPGVPSGLLDRLAPGGLLVCGLADATTGRRQMLVGVRPEATGRPMPLGPASLPPAQSGRSLSL